MNFELGIANVSQCHWLLQDATSAWAEGRTCDAFTEIRKTLKNLDTDVKPECTAIDWCFMYDVASACGRQSDAAIFARAGHTKFPNDPMLGLLHAWELAARGKFFESRKLLEHLQTTNTNQARIDAVAAYNFAIVGWRKSAEQAHEKAKRQADDDAFCWYILSRASSRSANWLQSVEEGQQVLKLAPTWTRPRCAQSDSLISIGRAKEAYQLVFDHEEMVPHCMLDITRSMCADSIGEQSKTIDQLEMLLDRWPRSRMTRFAAYYLALLLIKCERNADAIEIVKRYRLKRLDGLDSKPAKQVFIPLPLVAQTHNHCVPTVAAMVAESQEVPATPIDLADAMMTQYGTPIFRMIDHMRSLGFKCVCVKAEESIIEKLLDNGVPLIGTLIGLFNSHVEVICGYHQGLKLFHVRDPMHWFGNSFPYDSLQKRYYESGGLWVLIAPERQSEVQIQDQWIDSVGTAYVDLVRACTRGQLQMAEQAHQKIDDDHPLAFARDQRSRSVVITPGEFQQRLANRKMPQKSADIKLSNIHSMLLRIDDETADEIYAMASTDELNLGDTFLKYIHVRCLIAKHQWERAETELEQLTNIAPGFDNAWQELSNVQSQLGKLQLAQQSLAVAIDIAPDKESYQKRAIELDGGSLSFEQQLQPIQRLIETYPDSPEYFYDFVNVLVDGPDGAQYENALKNCVKYFPRDPIGYEELGKWYWLQQRNDLAKSIMSEGRKLIGEEELPVAIYELSEDQTDASVEAEEKKDEGKNESLESGNHFNSILKKIADRLDDQEKNQHGEHDVREILKWPELDELKKMETDGGMPWWNSVYWRSSTIRHVVNGKSAVCSERQCADAAKSLLPDQNLPGIPERYTCSMLQSVGNVPRLVAGELVAWIDRVCTQKEQFASLVFERAFLLEKMGLFNEAEEQLKELINRHSAYGPAFYRLGQIAASRGDFENALSHYNRCLEITPGNHGSLRELILISQHLQSDQETDFLERRAKLYPYSKSYLYETAFALGRTTGHDSAVERFNLANEFFDDSQQQLLVARYWADVQQFDKALEIVEKTSVDDEDVLIADWIRVDCAVAERNLDKVLDLLQEMEKANPDNTDISDQMARVLRELNPEEAKRFAKKKLLQGHDIMLLAYICIQHESQPEQIAKEIVEQVEPDHQPRIAEVCADALNRPEYFDALIKFLQWTREKFPQLTTLQTTLAVRLSMKGSDKKAEAVAKELFDRDPDNPDFINLYDVTIQDSKPKESIKLFKREFELNGTSDAMCRIARGYQLVGDDKNAKHHYFQTLEINPTDTLAITNLVYGYRVVADDLFDNIHDAIIQGKGIDDQYFLVIAVKVALKLKCKLSEQWYSLALDRLRVAQSDGGFNDEIPLLKRSISAWESLNRNDGAYTCNILDRIWGKWFWPRTAWVAPGSDI